LHTLCGKPFQLAIAAIYWRKWLDEKLTVDVFGGRRNNAERHLKVAWACYRFFIPLPMSSIDGVLGFKNTPVDSE
jgi:hypothetical protein